MKNLTMLLAALLFSPVAGANEKPTTLEIFEAAYNHLQKGTRILAIEDLQQEGVIVAYYLTVGTEESERETGVFVSADLDVLPSIKIEDVAHLRFDPPKVRNVTKKNTKLFNMPIIDEKEFFKPKLEPAGVGQPISRTRLSEKPLQSTYRGLGA